MAVLWRVALLALLGSMLAFGAGSPAHADPPQQTFATVVSSRYDPVGQQTNRTYLPSDSTFQVQSIPGERDEIVFKATRPGDAGLTVSVRAAQGESLQPGTYEAPGREADNVPGVGLTVGESGCSTGDPGRGRFTILDVSTDLSRYWMVWEIFCRDMPGPVAFGEVKYHEPAGADPLLTVAPDRLDWPVGYVDVAQRTAPVTLVNHSTDTVHVSDVVVSGDPDFSLVRNGCADVASDSTCALDLAFKPTAAGARHGEIAFTNSATGVRHTIPLSGSGDPTHSSLDTSAFSPPWPGDPEPAAHKTPADASFDFHTHSAPVEGSVKFNPPYLGLWSLYFSTATDAPLVEGRTYFLDPDTIRDPSPDTGESCVSSAICVGGGDGYGAFHVYEVKYDAGRVTAFSITFERRGLRPTSPPLYGSIAWHASQPARPVPTRPFGRRPTSMSLRSDEARRAYGTGATLTGVLENIDAHHLLPHRRVLVQTRPYGTGYWHKVGYTSTDGTGHFRARVRPRATADYRVQYAGSTVFTAATTPIVRVGTPRMTASQRRSPPQDGEPVWVTARVLPSFAGRAVELLKRHASAWNHVGSQVLDDRGTVRFVFHPEPFSLADYRLSLPGRSGYAPVSVDFGVSRRR